MIWYIVCFIAGLIIGSIGMMIYCIIDLTPVFQAVDDYYEEVKKLHG